MDHQTQAAVLRNINAPLDLMMLTIPDLRVGQVLVDVAYSGICRSQLNEIKGRKGDDPYLPHTLGHEGSGVVLQIGEGVCKVSPGDHVVITWIPGSGKEVRTCTYNADSGFVNSGAVSTFLSKAVISENRLVPIERSNSLRDAALLGCAVPTGAGTIVNIAKPESSHTVAIFGLGGVGQCAVIAAKNSGVKTIIGIDKLDDRLAIGCQLGVSHAINAATDNVSAQVGEITEGRGVDFAIEASGDVRAMEVAFSCVRSNGGRCIISGNPSVADVVTINPFDVIKGRRLIGSWGGETNIDSDIPVYLRWLADGALPIDKLTTTEYGLHEINIALEDFEKGKVLRPLIKMPD